MYKERGGLLFLTVDKYSRREGALTFLEKLFFLKKVSKNEKTPHFELQLFWKIVNAYFCQLAKKRLLKYGPSRNLFID